MEVELLDRMAVSALVDGWQELIDLLADIVNVPAGLVMHLNEQRELEVFVSSKTSGNPYAVGDKEIMENSGLYCERVIKTNNQLKVPNALIDDEWKNNPDVKLNMISYLGEPILWPNGNPFGTICILDNKENIYNKQYEELVH
ncbi:MAG: hypothetical protein OCD01_17455 [Fibrobacterales bacterium]